jgi:hypothetical protein
LVHEFRGLRKYLCPIAGRELRGSKADEPYLVIYLNSVREALISFRMVVAAIAAYPMALAI